MKTRITQREINRRYPCLTCDTGTNPIPAAPCKDCIEIHGWRLFSKLLEATLEAPPARKKS